MPPSVVYVLLIVLQICSNLEAKLDESCLVEVIMASELDGEEKGKRTTPIREDVSLHYALIFPSTIHVTHPNYICLHLEDVKGDCNVMISLTIGKKTTPLLTEQYQSASFSCNTVQIPNELSVIQQSGTLFLSIQTADELIHESRRVNIKKKMDSKAEILIQTDKPVYKPGQTVKIRIVSINGNFQPEYTELPFVELQDPGKNRIGQWVNISLTQGIADLSFSLFPEPQLGEYSIRVKDKVQAFSVEEYVLPKFEVTLELPNLITNSMETFPVKTCSRYTYGKPVQGSYKISICQKVTPEPYHFGPPVVRPSGSCVNFNGKLDHLGCATNTMRTSSFQLSSSLFMHPSTKLEGVVTVTEEGTGVELSTTGEARIVFSSTVSFLDPKSIYKPGMPYYITVEVTGSDKRPIPGQEVYLTCGGCSTTNIDTLMTNDKGQAYYIIHHTANWTQTLTFKASTSKDTRPSDFMGYPGDAHMVVDPLYSPSKSFLNLQPLEKDQSCDSQQEVNVQYVIRQSALQKDTKQLDLYYLVTSKGRIQLYGSQKIEAKKPYTDLQGELSIRFSLDVSDSNSIHLLVYMLLPSGELVADNVKIKMTRCFRNKVHFKISYQKVENSSHIKDTWNKHRKIPHVSTNVFEVSVGFLPEEVFPGSDVSLKVQATPGSLCGLRVVDKSVVLMRPEQEWTAERVYDLFADPQLTHPYGMPMSTDVELIPCANGPTGAYYSNPFRYIHTNEDIHKLFTDIQLKIITSAEVRKPVDCTDGPDFPFGGGYGVPGRPFVPITASARAVGGVGQTVAGVLPSPFGIGNDIPDPIGKIEIIRKYFPETWIWELTPIGNSGTIELHHLAPDTITDWMAGAMCMGPNGFGISPPVSLRVFQPFFVDLALPYSVVRGETFTLKASVFNYLQQCIKVQTTLLPSLEIELEACPQCQYSSCLCADESKTFQWNVKAAKLGEVNITVRTEAVNTPDLCNNEVPLVPKQGNVDTVIKPLIVKPGGVLVEKSHNSMICNRAGQENSKTENFSLKLPGDILKDSDRAHMTVVGDMMGTTLEHLDHLLAMPSGCGEQNMVRFAPNIFVLQYLEKTNQLNSEIKSKATNFMKNGYQRQLTYKRDDGSYSAYGKDDPEGNTWLTAFVLKSFSKSRPYISIDEVQLNASYAWLIRNRYYTGCFRNVGKLFQTSMKGGVEDDVSLSTYVTIALLEAGISPQDPLVRDSILCLQGLALNVNNMYTQALLAYAFTLYGDTYYRRILLDRLELKAIRRDGQLYWQPKPQTTTEDPFWRQASSTEVEMTSYVLLSLLAATTKNLVYAAEIVNWLSKQQNAFGGFSSTQDTIVALQAMALYAEATFTDKGDATVTVTSTRGFREQFSVNNDNRLLLQRTSLPDVPGEYTITSSGSRCVYVQALLRYNTPPQGNDAAFRIQLAVITIQCTSGKPTKLQINFFVAYTGLRQKSNMALIEVKMLSGFFPLKSSIEQLKSYGVIKRAEEEDDTLTLYMDELGRTQSSFALLVEQEYPVKNLKPAAVKIYDYYEKDEQAIAQYNSPCTWI